MDEKRLSQILREIAQEEIPDDMNLWSDIQKAAQRPSRWMRLAPKSRIGWVALLVAALLTIGATAYAVDFLLQNFDPGLEAADNANLIVYLNDTQTIGDVSVTLEYAYADANRIAIAYNGTALVPITSSASLGFTEIHLTDDQGREFNNYLFGGGGGGGGGSAEATVVAVSFGLVDNYDASIIDDSPDELHLHLELTVGDMTPIMGGGGGGGGGGSVAPAEAEPFEPVGPFIFDFTVPFNPGRVMNEPQTVTAADIPMRLNRVVVTPSLTRLELCYEQPPINDNSPYWNPVVSLTVDGEEVLAGTPLYRDMVSTSDDAECANYNILQALNDQLGEWELSIDTLLLPGTAPAEEVRQALEERGIETIDQPGGGWGYNTPDDISHSDISEIMAEINARYQQIIEGPWTFTFDIE